jgi:hypothetical protein
MSRRLAARRSELLLQGAVQRRELAIRFEALEEHLQSADRGLALLRRITTNPLFIVYGIATVLWLRRRARVQLLLRGAALAFAARRLVHPPEKPALPPAP